MLTKENQNFIINGLTKATWFDQGYEWQDFSKVAAFSKESNMALFSFWNNKLFKIPGESRVSKFEERTIFVLDFQLIDFWNVTKSFPLITLSI